MIMTATLTECMVYNSVIVKHFTLERVEPEFRHLVVEYDTDTRLCQIFTAEMSSHGETPKMIKILTDDDSCDYDVIMDRLILADLLGRRPQMILDTEDYDKELNEGPEYETYDDREQNY
jgi:hypothetical protein